jgi:hypothetical protein
LTSLWWKPEQNTLDCDAILFTCEVAGWAYERRLLLWYVTVVMYYAVQQCDAREQKRECGSRTKHDVPLAEVAMEIINEKVL